MKKFIKELCKKFCKTKHKYSIRDMLEDVEKTGFKGFGEILSEKQKRPVKDTVKMQ